MQEMVRKDLTEGIIAYEKDLTKEMLQKKEVLPGAECIMESGILKVLEEASGEMSRALVRLKEDTDKAEKITEDILKQAVYYKDTVLKDMEELREYADKAEAVIPDKYLSYPTYGEMLFSLT